MRRIYYSLQREKNLRKKLGKISKKVKEVENKVEQNEVKIEKLTQITGIVKRYYASYVFCF